MTVVHAAKVRFIAQSVKKQTKLILILLWNFTRKIIYLSNIYHQRK